MIKILVVSDTHGRSDILNDVVNLHKDALVVLHAGDGYMDLEKIRPNFPRNILAGVAGNCDYLPGSDSLMRSTLSIDSTTIFLTHGHLYNVHYGIQRLIYASMEQSAQICIYGHTHIPRIEMADGIHIMNPGSLARPRSVCPTYGIIEIDGENISMRIEEYNA